MVVLRECYASTTLQQCERVVQDSANAHTRTTPHFTSTPRIPRQDCAITTPAPETQLRHHSFATLPLPKIIGGRHCANAVQPGRQGKRRLRLTRTGQCSNTCLITRFHKNRGEIEIVGSRTAQSAMLHKCRRAPAMPPCRRRLGQRPRQGIFQGKASMPQRQPWRGRHEPAPATPCASCCTAHRQTVPRHRGQARRGTARGTGRGIVCPRRAGAPPGEISCLGVRPRRRRRPRGRRSQRHLWR